MVWPIKPAFVQGATTDVAAGKGTYSPTGLTGVAAGNCLILAASGQSTSSLPVLSSVTDSSGDIWTRVLADGLTPGLGFVEVWYLLNASAGTHTLTVVMGTVGLSGVEFDEFSGVATVEPIVDRTGPFAGFGVSTGSFTNTTGSPVAIVAPTAANELIYVASISSSQETASPGAPWSTRAGPLSGGVQENGVAWAVSGSNDTVVASWTQSGLLKWGTVIVSLRGASIVSSAPNNDPGTTDNQAIFVRQSHIDYEDFLFDSLGGSGTGVLAYPAVAGTNCLVVPTSVSTFTFDVAGGTCFLNWGRIQVSSVSGIAVSAADPVFSRRDLVYVTSTGTVTYLAGTALAQPCIPTLPVNSIPLAVIDVPPGATVLDNGLSTSTAKITDKRSLLAPPDNIERGSFLTTALGSGTSFETMPREYTNSSLIPSTGTLQLSAIYLPAGLSVGHISFMSVVQAANTPLNQWFCLVDHGLTLLATTTDDTTTAWGTNTVKTLAISKTADGTRSTFMTAYSGLYYVGIMVKATTTPDIAAVSCRAQVCALSPSLNGTSTSSLSTPSTFPLTVSAPGGASGLLWSAVGK